MAKNDTIALKLVADNNDLTKKLGQSTRQIKSLERQLDRAGKNSGSVFGPLSNSLKGAAGPLGGVAGKFSSIATAGAGMNPILGVAAVGFAGIASGVDMAVSGLDKLSNLVVATNKLQRETGMAAETASAWVSIGKRYGLGVSQLSTQFGFLAKKMTASEGGGKAADKALKMFANAGVSQALLKTKNMDKILLAVADRFKAMPGGADKTTLAMQLFGKSGKQLLPVLSQGGKGIGKLKGDMADFGLTVDRKAKKQVIELKKASKVLSDFWDGLQIRLAKNVIPKLVVFAEAAKDAAKGMSKGKKPAGELAGKLYDVGQAMKTIAGYASRVLGFLGGLEKYSGKKGWGNLLDKLSSLGSKVFNAIPHAAGGVFTSPHIGLVAEAGPEAIIPLARPARAAQVMRQAGLTGSSNSFVINNYGNALDEGALAAKIGWQLAARGVS